MSTSLDDRYGRSSRRRWPLYLAVAVAVAALGWLAWVIWAQSTPAVTSGLKSYRIGDHTSSATVHIRLADTDVRATCLLRATAADHSVVGEVHFSVDDPPARSFTTTQEIRTERRPTTIESIGCTAPGQKQPR